MEKCHGQYNACMTSTNDNVCHFDVHIDGPVEDSDYFIIMRFIQDNISKKVLEKKKRKDVFDVDYLTQLENNEKFDKMLSRAEEEWVGEAKKEPDYSWNSGNNDLGFPETYAAWDPAPMLKLKNKEVCPLQPGHKLCGPDIINRQNFYWIKDTENSDSPYAKLFVKDKKYFAQLNVFWVISTGSILSNYHCWAPENVIPVLVHIMDMHPKEPIAIDIIDAQDYANDIWKRDFAKRKKNPDNPVSLELRPSEQRKLFSSLVVLIVIQDDFVKSNKVLDLFKYIPDKYKNVNGFRDIYRYAISRKHCPILFRPPTEDIEKIESRLKSLRDVDKAPFVYKDILEEFSNVINDISQACSSYFNFNKD